MRTATVTAPLAGVLVDAAAPVVIAVQAATVAAVAALMDLAAIAPNVVVTLPSTPGLVTGTQRPATSMHGSTSTRQMTGAQQHGGLVGVSAAGSHLTGTTTSTTITGG